MVNPELVEVGMALQVCDDDSEGWLVSTACVVDKDGSTLWLDRPLVYDYHAHRGGRVSSGTSLIEIVGAEDVHVAGLVLDGSGGHALLDGCRGGGLYIYNSQSIEIDSVVVHHFSGDGLSWQITQGVRVTHCDVHQCTHYGLHPGTGAWETVVQDCDVYANGSDGLYLCWRVQGGHFVRNTFRENGGYGISLGHKDTDNRFEDNGITKNASGGGWVSSRALAKRGTPKSFHG